MLRRRPRLLFGCLLLAAITASLPAFATGVVTGGRWTRDIRQGAPVGAPSGGAGSQVVAYFIELDNASSAPVELTVVWKVNGVDSQPVRLSTTWRATWVYRQVQGDTRELVISVRDAQGTELHTDRMTFTPGGG